MRTLIAGVAAALMLLTAAPASAAPVNQPPVVVDDTVAFMSDNRQFVIKVLDNDSDADGDQLTVTGTGTSTKGYLQHSSTWLYYSPRTGQLGDDTFTYSVSDGRGGTATGTVTVTLYAPLPRPADVTGTTAPGTYSLSWSPVPGASAYRISRDRNPVATTADTSWVDTGLNDAGGYHYWVEALDSDGRHGLASYPELHRAPRPWTPDWLDVDPTGTGTSLELTWDSRGEGYGNWRVWRDGAPIGLTPVPRFVDTGLTEGTEYSYQVSKVETLESLLSTPVRGTPWTLTDIGWLVWDYGWTSGTFGQITVPERGIPGGRRQDHLNGIVLQKTGQAPLPVWRPFVAALDASAGAGDLGFPIAVQECGPRGCGQFFEGGSIWYSHVTSPQIVRHDIEDGWAASGWEDGPLGYPTADQLQLPGGLWQPFEDGGVYWSAETGSHGVVAESHDAYAAWGGPAGHLGFPTTGDNCGLRGDGCWQGFEGGSIHWSPATGAHVTDGAMRDAWARTGWENGRLGYPTTDATCGLRGDGCWQAFQGGSIHWSPATGARVTDGAMRDAWARAGWENGNLGYPTTDAVCGLRGGGCWQGFQGLPGWQGFLGGSIHWSPATGAHATRGAIRDAWARAGWENGRLGYPTTDEVCGLRHGGCWQGFQGGSIHGSMSGIGYVTDGAIRDAWARTGWENGRLGYPVANATCGLRGGGCWQEFQGGSIHWSPATGAHATDGAMRGAWARIGWENGRLGYPTTDATCGLRGGGCWQGFQGGTIHWSPATGAHATSGAIRDAWAREGWENGRLGYPVGMESMGLSSGEIRQRFQGGYVTVDQRTGRVTVR